MNYNFEKAEPPPLKDDRSTKKARFHSQGADGDNPVTLSFKDKLMESQRTVVEDAINEDGALDFEPEDIMVEHGINMPSISFSPKIHAQLVRPWQYAVVVKLLGKSIGYRALCNRLGALWNSTTGFNVIDLENNYFLIRFKSNEDMEFVLTQGPWTLMGHYLIVQPWSPQFDSSKEECDSVIVWIRLPGMALHYYHKRILRMIGQVIGNVVRVDYNTESATRGKFARIAVEVSLSKPLVSQFLLDGKVQKVEYENLPFICFSCGKYGHYYEACPDRGLGGEKTTTAAAPGKDAGRDDQNEPKFGPWMVVSRKGKQRVNKGKELIRDLNHDHRNNFGNSSRFEVLDSDMAGEIDKEANCEGFVPNLDPHGPTNNLNRHKLRLKKQLSFKKSPSPMQPTRTIRNQKIAIPDIQSAPSPMQNLQVPRDLNKDHANQPNLPTHVFAHTSLNPLFHTAISFPTVTNINPMSTPSNPRELLVTNVDL
ncbi:hypothetical protein CUMW_268340 [Citrus unshiu]|uniref:CCHC-type domain-containing protein n=1 Tax=Citrus unshiu TaxID=55188 RepID=A0A2H5QWJ5_CITUN|nr:hypothetical protein CUMW_268340 [Citrus unshiu]